MANMILGWPNRVDIATLSGGSWSSTLGLTNLQNRALGNQAQSSNALTSSTIIKADLATTGYDIRAITLHNHNLSQTATWTLKIGTTDGGTDVYNSGSMPVYNYPFDNDLLPFRGGTYHMAVHAMYNSSDLSATFKGRYVQIEISDTSNSDGYVRIGRLGIWSGILPSKNMLWGQTSSSAVRGVFDYSEGGNLTYEKRRSRRVTNFTLDFIDDTDRVKHHELMLNADTTDEALWLPDFSSDQDNQVYGVYGNITQVPTLERKFLQSSDAEYRITELI